MKKLNNKGFILAETLVVSLFLMVIFTMIYSNFYPLIGEYERRENYDDVDGKYAAYWIKRMIESNGYNINIGNKNEFFSNGWGYIRFECGDMTGAYQQKTCANLVHALEVNNCDNDGNECDIYITRYRIGYESHSENDFKETVRNGRDGKALKIGDEKCSKNPNREQCKTNLLAACGDDENCKKRLKRNAFPSAVKDYILSLPNYKYYHGTTQSKFRVIVVVRHKKESKYYSFSTIEVSK